MACSINFIEYVCEVLRPLGVVRARKMMGDYVIYVNEKCVITACDNCAYIKMLPCIEEMMKDAETGCAYTGAKVGYILGFEDHDFSRKVVSAVWDALPFPRKKK